MKKNEKENAIAELTQKYGSAKVNAALKIVGRRGNAHVGLFVSALVIVILGLALLNPVQSYVGNAALASPANAGILNIIPTFWVIGVLVVAAGLAYIGVKSR